MAFLNQTAQLVEEGKINQEIFWWCQNPFESGLSGFLVRNYSNLDIKAIIVRSKKIFHENPRRVAAYNSMLTGESLKDLELFEKAMQEDVNLPKTDSKDVLEK